jgi:alanine dehydrogenase
VHVGIPRERRTEEYRVGLTPAGVQLLTAGGHACSVEHDAGRGAGFPDVDYQAAGGTIVYTPEEAYGRADLVVKVGPLTDEEALWLRDGSAVMGFLHLLAGKPVTVRTLLAKRVTAIAYELIQNEDGSLPVLKPLSQIAGRMAPQIAARLLQNNFGGHGILLHGVPGVPPAEIVIVGAGTVGSEAARAFIQVGASVRLLDQHLSRLQYLDQFYGTGSRPTMMVSHQFNIGKTARFADVLIGAVHVPGQRAPVVITRDVLRIMRPRSIVLDISIDQGGCVETSRPTTHRDPTFVEENIIHYCVPNMTSAVARTATHAFNNAAWPFVRHVATYGLDATLAGIPAFRRAVATHEGRVLHPALATLLGTSGGAQ